MYGGTRSEMERLLADAEKISGIHYDISNFSDVTQAIHVIQQNLGITGTTAKEAEHTLSGSFNSMKASFKDLLGNLVLGKDIMPSVKNLLMTTETFVIGNLAPAVGRIIQSLGTIIVQGLPQLLTSMANGINQLSTYLQNNDGKIKEHALKAVQSFSQGLAQNLPVIIQAIGNLIVAIINFLAANWPSIVQAGAEIILQLAVGLIQAMPSVVSALAQLAVKVIAALANLAVSVFQSGINLIINIANGIISGIGNAVQAVGNVGTNIKNAFNGIIDSALSWGRDLIRNFVSGINSKVSSVKKAVSGVAKEVKSLLGFSEPETGPLSDFHTYAPDMIDLFTSGIYNNLGGVSDAMNTMAGEALGTAQGALSLQPQQTYIPQGGADNSQIINLLRIIANKDNSVYLDGKEITNNVSRRVTGSTRALNKLKGAY